MSRAIDTGLAAAETRLERLDDQDAEDAHGPSLSRGDVDPDDAAIHVEVDPSDLPEDDVTVIDDGYDEELAVLLDAFAEAFNARDLDGLLELVSHDLECPGLGNDRDNLPDAVEGLWDRCPTALLTRTHLDGAPLLVLWEVGTDGHWSPRCPVFGHADDGHLGVLEFDDAGTLDGVALEEPEREFEEGAQWSEWEDGVSDH